MNNEEKAKLITKGFLKEGLIKKTRIQELLLKMSRWKDKQFDEEKKDLLELVDMLPIDETNQTIIEDLKGLLK